MTIRSPLPSLSPVPGLSPVLDSTHREEERWRPSLALERQDVHRSFFAPPDMPVARTQAFRRAFDATMKDDAFPTEAKKLRLKANLARVKTNVLVNVIMNTSPPVAARVRGALNLSTARNETVFHPAHL